MAVQNLILISSARGNQKLAGAKGSGNVTRNAKLFLKVTKLKKSWRQKHNFQWNEAVSKNNYSLWSKNLKGNWLLTQKKDQILTDLTILLCSWIWPCKRYQFCQTIDLLQWTYLVLQLTQVTCILQQVLREYNKNFS